jgi:subtilase family serine protease
MRLRRIGMAMLAAGGLVLAGANTVAAAPGGQAAVHAHRVCATGKDGSAGCHSWVVTDAKGKPMASTGPTGLSPDTIKAAYNWTAIGDGAGKTIAIVDAYDDPTAKADLDAFDKTFFPTTATFPSCTSTISTSCFSKVNQTGGTKLPRADAGWALEISLDVQWAHAIAPKAKILLVEASSASFTNLLTAEDYASNKNKGAADYISNSWGGSEFSGETAYDAHFSTTGVSYFVSAGDSGLPAEYPSASNKVISVGGTTLNGNGTEYVWTDGGGGCSAYESADPAQSRYASYGQAGCRAGFRATPDVALDADPATGVAVYDSTSYQGQRGWFTVGGTSASSPMWAARSADSQKAVDAAAVYGGGISFRNETPRPDGATNGGVCELGFDLCTGLGTWTGNTGP